jgi:hypothetical protein
MGYAVGVPMGLVHIHVLKYCQHTRSSFLSRDIPLNLMLKNNIAGLGEIDQAVQHAILDRVITHFRQQPQLVKDWCTWILQIPHQRVGFGNHSYFHIWDNSPQVDGSVPIVVFHSFPGNNNYSIVNFRVTIILFPLSLSPGQGLQR